MKVFLVTMDIEKAFDSLDHNFLISALEKYLFILALEILFHLIKSKPEIKVHAIFDHCHLYSAYADDTTIFLQDTISITITTIFLQDTISIKHMVDAFYFFSYFSGLKPNLTKSEMSGIGVLKGVQVAVCGMR